jgi:hypothetical protein
MTKRKNKWIAFFSQTGSEIVAISQALGRWPDYIVTNRMDDDNINPALLHKSNYSTSGEDGSTLIRIPKWPREVDYMNIADYMGFSILNEKWKDNVLVTLHGYLRILPPSFCDKTRIYNGHPGLITKYPELKGFNPQKKAFEAGTYKMVGSVIHEVIPELDSGDVVAEGEIKNDFDNLENCTLALHDLSIQLWTKFLKDKL